MSPPAGKARASSLIAMVAVDDMKTTRRSTAVVLVIANRMGASQALSDMVERVARVRNAEGLSELMRSVYHSYHYGAIWASPRR